MPGSMPASRRPVVEIRRAALGWGFSLLYGRLAFLHEPAGRLLNGPAWNCRRMMALDPPVFATLLDLGCGEGCLVARAARAGVLALGIDRSMSMIHRAQRRGVPVVCASASALPVSDGSMDVVTSTYPGVWIFDAAVFREVARVLRPGGEVRILLGGSITAGRWSQPRRILARIIYGKQNSASPEAPTNDLLVGSIVIRKDRWGESVWWMGRRPNYD